MTAKKPEDLISSAPCVPSRSAESLCSSLSSTAFEGAEKWGLEGEILLKILRPRAKLAQDASEACGNAGSMLMIPWNMSLRFLSKKGVRLAIIS